MNLALWIVQGLLAAAFAVAGLLKLAKTRQQLAEKGMSWTPEFTDLQVKLIGLVEVLGAIGLVVPRLTGILPVLTPVAAFGLVLILGGAVQTHLRHKESPVAPLILGALCVFVALGRFGVLG
jgi:uncharacterized membrane protein